MRPPGWASPRGIVVTIVAIGAFSLLAYTQMTPQTQGREEVIATIIKNWQQAHPASERFVILPDFNNHAVLDKDTSLIWELSPTPTAVTWNEARSTCVTRTTGGQKGWRLPAPAEMRSLVGPAVDSPIPNIPPGHPFVNIQPTAYWTVVPEANQPSYARYVDAFLGNVLSFIKIYTYPVWCVRGPIKPDEE
ncbi:MAG: DUF1566 domain-containing protein [Nitrospira sp.]|nr:DUF1566 domain-containing protein [Nitrospira sp.]